MYPIVEELTYDSKEGLTYEETIHQVDGLVFEDIADQLNNKTFFENLIYSNTKLVFSSKEEVLLFLEKMLEYEFFHFADGYLENLLTTFENDPDFLTLFHKLIDERNDS